MKQELKNRALKPGTGNWFPGPCQGASLIELLMDIGDDLIMSLSGKIIRGALDD